MTIRQETALVRPFVVCAVLRGVRFDPLRYNSFIDLQVQGLAGGAGRWQAQLECCWLHGCNHRWQACIAVACGMRSQKTIVRCVGQAAPGFHMLLTSPPCLSPLPCRTSCTRTCAGSARWWPSAPTTSPRSRHVGRLCGGRQDMRCAGQPAAGGNSPKRRSIKPCFNNTPTTPLLQCLLAGPLHLSGAAAGAHLLCSP